MDRLELDVGHAGLDQSRHVLVIPVQELLQGVQAFRQMLGRGRDESGVARPAAADPVLAAPELARHLVGAPSAPEQDAVNLAQEPQAQRQLVAGTAQPVLEGGHIARHLGHIVERHVLHALGLEGEQVRERGLCALDLRREDRLLANVEVNENLRVGQQAGETVETPSAWLARSSLRWSRRRSRGDIRRQGRRHEARTRSPAVVVITYRPRRGLGGCSATGLILRGGCHNSRARRPATRKRQAAWSRDWMMKPRRS
jgi:hypothetical protein